MARTPLWCRRSVELVQHVHHLLPETAQFVSVHHRQALEHFPSGSGQPYPLAALVGGILCPPHEPSRVGTVDQFDHGVMSELQCLGEVAHDGRVASRMPPHGKEQLVLCGCDAGVAGGLLGEVLEDPECMTKARQGLVFAVRQLRIHVTGPFVERSPDVVPRASSRSGVRRRPLAIGRRRCRLRSCHPGCGTSCSRCPARPRSMSVRVQIPTSRPSASTTGRCSMSSSTRRVSASSSVASGVTLTTSSAAIPRTRPSSAVSARRSPRVTTPTHWPPSSTSGYA